MQPLLLNVTIAATLFTAASLRSDDMDLLTGKWSVKKVDDDGQNYVENKGYEKNQVTIPVALELPKVKAGQKCSFKLQLDDVDGDACTEDVDNRSTGEFTISERGSQTYKPEDHWRYTIRWHLKYLPPLHGFAPEGGRSAWHWSGPGIRMALARSSMNTMLRRTSESENKLLARRLLEEVVNTRDVDRLSEFLAPDFVVLPCQHHGH